MSLLIQIQVVVISFFFGFFFLMLFGFINRVLKRIMILKNIVIIGYFLFATYSYFYCLVLLNDGILRIYYPLFIALGGVFYQKFYAVYFLQFYESICLKIHKLIITPICLKIKKIKSILKIKKEERKKRNGKRKEKKSLD